jgi:hypothetical protein
VFDDQEQRFTGIAELGLFGTVLGMLWLNGNANGHSIFLLLPQLLDWSLFFCLAAVLMSNFLRTSAGSAFAYLHSLTRVRPSLQRVNAVGLGEGARARGK